MVSAVSHYPATESDIENTDDWVPIKKPFIPEWELNETASIDPSEWDIIIIPNDPVDETDLEIYEGEPRPLTSLIGQESTDGKEEQDVQTEQDDRDGIDLSDLRLSKDD
ncbi:hypothetical protein Htur_3980 (plasmid) [Haloterrigena turkmenica DSM 5511]|uniref:Uncharacterized protein n=1 Tax=Haloterrigena turkmenica (strain ATCC 51198 / DSM 5511 / JCM 9101 / NCIMB 13204 / VKM B-1734 / 4k) TaxID=543526 RepID=D2S0D3_HALTV|nr:hypothetical protein [Haloterrigena turkmenica]ADB62830.1 hypothetical protein Htur_3980 [Haloterrigena turkmenica DSM 5511]